MVQGFEMRVGDAEREAAAAELREHFASGRLTQDELNERLDRTFAAKTRGDLNAVMTDLPGSPSWPSGQPGWSTAGAAGAAGSGAPFGGSQARWTGQGAWDGGPQGGAGCGWQRGGRRMAGSMIASVIMLWALLGLGIVAVFGIGGGRPFGIVLIFAAFALLRRLLFVIFGRRRGGGRGPRRRRW